MKHYNYDTVCRQSIVNFKLVEISNANHESIIKKIGNLKPYLDNLGH